MALALALFEFFFFFQTSGVEETTGPFGPNRLGFTLAWIALVYLSFQLLTIPLAVGGRDRFIGVVDGMESRPRKSGQDDRWSFCLTAGTLCPSNQEIR
jgi:hypothetical protein